MNISVPECFVDGCYYNLVCKIDDSRLQSVKSLIEDCICLFDGENLEQACKGRNYAEAVDAIKSVSMLECYDYADKYEQIVRTVRQRDTRYVDLDLLCTMLNGKSLHDVRSNSCYKTLVDTLDRINKTVEDEVLLGVVLNWYFVHENPMNCNDALLGRAVLCGCTRVNGFGMFNAFDRRKYMWAALNSKHDDDACEIDISEYADLVLDILMQCLTDFYDSNKHDDVIHSFSVKGQKYMLAYNPKILAGYVKSIPKCQDDMISCLLSDEVWYNCDVGGVSRIAVSGEKVYDCYRLIEISKSIDDGVLNSLMCLSSNNMDKEGTVEFINEVGEFLKELSSQVSGIDTKIVGIVYHFILARYKALGNNGATIGRAVNTVYSGVYGLPLSKVLCARRDKYVKLIQSRSSEDIIDLTEFISFMLECMIIALSDLSEGNDSKWHSNLIR